uniref:Lysenin-related protein 2 n=2 Tax=cellular organisms TaxID=131567 RepID=TXLR2_EISFE|nr:RecName: Full=Lysenin-related protein 2; Short=LRP-2; AltName: Full=Fetidin; AltName: Full=Hemolysin; AltName: Full=Lysenin-3; AltName: Full=efL3 [Eisenia fetida]AAB67727.1 hemolysin [Eisenia andrei]BAA21520.1 lysenin-related protein [Eisenia fetida]
MSSRAGIAEGYEQIEVDVVAVWKEGYVYENRGSTSVEQKIKITKGMRNLNSETKTLTASHSIGSTISTGDLFEIATVDVSYSYSHEESQVSMTETEVYESKEIEHTITIPPTSKFTRWQLNADVGGADIEYMYLIDEVTPIGGTLSIPQVIKSRAKILVGREIYLGETEIRIKHADRKEYMTVVSRKSWPAATLGHSKLYKFVLYEDMYGFRIKTLNTMYSGYEYAYSSDQGGIYFDQGSDNPKQRWAINKSLPLRHGDVVTFMNKYFTRSGLCYYDGPATDVYCLDKREDKWILEVVKP